MSGGGPMSHLIRMKVFGVGGGGTNIVSTMLQKSDEQITYYGLDTNQTRMHQLPKEQRLVIDEIKLQEMKGNATKSKGRKTKSDVEAQVKEQLKQCDMVMLIACLGGGVGSHMLPLVANCAKDLGILTIVFVTLPFSFEGDLQIRKATKSIQQLPTYADSLITISNQQWLCLAAQEPITSALSHANEVVMQGVQAIYEVINQTDYINVDFADMTSIFKKHKYACIGVGHGYGVNKIEDALHDAFHVSFLDNPLSQKQDAIIQIRGSRDITLDDVEQTFALIKERLGSSLDVIFGMAFDESLEDEVIITIISTGDTQKIELNSLSKKGFL